MSVTIVTGMRMRHAGSTEEGHLAHSGVGVTGQGIKE